MKNSDIFHGGLNFDDINDCGLAGTELRSGLHAACLLAWGSRATSLRERSNFSPQHGHSLKNKAHSLWAYVEIEILSSSLFVCVCVCVSLSLSLSLCVSLSLSLSVSLSLSLSACVSRKLGSHPQNLLGDFKNLRKIFGALDLSAWRSFSLTCTHRPASAD